MKWRKFNVCKINFILIIYLKKNIQLQKEETDDSDAAGAEGEKEYKPHNIQGRMGMKIPADKDKAGRRSKRCADNIFFAKISYAN